MKNNFHGDNKKQEREKNHTYIIEKKEKLGIKEKEVK